MLCGTARLQNLWHSPPSEPVAQPAFRTCGTARLQNLWHSPPSEPVAQPAFRTCGTVHLQNLSVPRIPKTPRTFQWESFHIRCSPPLVLGVERQLRTNMLMNSTSPYCVRFTKHEFWPIRM